MVLARVSFGKVTLSNTFKVLSNKFAVTKSGVPLVAKSAAATANETPPIYNGSWTENVPSPLPFKKSVKNFRGEQDHAESN